MRKNIVEKHRKIIDKMLNGIVHFLYRAQKLYDATRVTTAYGIGIIADVQNIYETENTTVENLYNSSLLEVIPAIGASCWNIWGSYEPETAARQDIYGTSDHETTIDMYGSDMEICEYLRIIWTRNSSETRYLWNVRSRNNNRHVWFRHGNLWACSRSTKRRLKHWYCYNSKPNANVNSTGNSKIWA